MNIKQVAIIALTFLIMDFAYAVTNDDSNHWRNRKGEGWFWYQMTEEEEPVKKPEPVKPIAATPTPPPKEAEEVKPKGPEPLSSAWLKINLPKFRDKAIDEPTSDNIQAYLYLQRISIDKASKFSDAVTIETLGNAILDESNRRSLGAFAHAKQDREAGRNKKEIIQYLTKSTGIFYFFDDSYGSKAQEPLIHALLRTSKFNIKPISINGAKTTLKNVVPDDGHAKTMNIKTLPAIVLVRADTGQMDILSQGVMPLDEIRKRLIIGAKRLSLINEEQFNATRSIDNLDIDLSKVKISADKKTKGEINATDILDSIKQQIILGE
jgi:conjugal transfer pilus assembly protein TraF